MDDQRLGAALRAVRIKRGWRQSQLAEQAGVSASLVSLIERGHLETLSVRTLRRVLAALDIRLDLNVRMRTGDIDRILNAAHAGLHEELAQMFSSLPEWLHGPEVSFAVYGERGVIDIVAFHPPTSSLLVVELKTELVDFENLLSTMDVRLRLASRIAAERGWRARSVSCWVVVADTASNRRRATTHRSLIRSAFPANGRAMRAWLSHPAGPIRAFSMWSNSNRSGVNRTPAMRRRVRRPKAGSEAA